MATCQDCGREFDTERGLQIHRTIEHDEEMEGVEEDGRDWNVFTVWKRPRYAFILGLLAGAVLVVSVVLSTPSTFQDRPDRIGERIVNHYRKIAPPTIEYALVGVEEHASGTYAVTLQVTSGAVTSNQTVYVTAGGDYVFESPPAEVQADVSALGEG